MLKKATIPLTQRALLMTKSRYLISILILGTFARGDFAFGEAQPQGDSKTSQGGVTLESTALTLYNNGTLAKQTFGVDKTSSLSLSPLPSNVVLKSLMLLLEGHSHNGGLLNYRFREGDKSPGSVEVALSKEEQEQLGKLNLIYAFRGLTWKSQYVIKIDHKAETVAMNCWFEVNNQTDVSYKKVSLQFIDGESLYLQEGQEKRSAPDSLRAYTFPGLIDISAGEAKRLNWFTQSGLMAKQELRVSMGHEHLEDLKGKPIHFPVETWLNLNAAKGSGLGMAMPSGSATVYFQDYQGNVELLGETHVTNLEEKQELSVRMPSGLARKSNMMDTTFLDPKLIDVTLDQTEYKKLSDKISEANYKLSIKNKSDRILNIKVTLDIPPCEDWSVIRENFGHSENSGRQISWVVMVQPGGENELKSRIRIVWNKPLV
jgi:hypothetical protein